MTPTAVSEEWLAYIYRQAFGRGLDLRFRRLVASRFSRREKTTEEQQLEASCDLYEQVAKDAGELLVRDDTGSARYMSADEFRRERTRPWLDEIQRIHAEWVKQQIDELSALERRR